MLALALVIPAFLQVGPVVLADSGWSSNLTGWTKKEGDDWFDEDGGKRITSSGKNTMMLAEGSWTNFQYEGDITFKNMSGHVSLLFRSDAGGWGSYKLQIEPSLNEIRLTGADGFFHKYNPAIPLTTDTLYHVEIEAVGSSIKVYFETDEIFDVTNGERAAGNLGILVWDGDVLLQNVNASEIVPPTPTFITNLSGWSYFGDAGANTETEEGLLLSSAGNYFAIAENVAENFEYEADITFQSNAGLASLVLRSNDNGWGSYMVQLDPFADKIRLLNADDQAENRLFEEYDIEIEQNTVNHVRVKAEGTQLSVYWNGADEPLISINDNAYTSGQLGLHIYNSNVVFQNLEAKVLGAAYPHVVTNLANWTPLESGTMEETAAGLKLESTGNYFAIADKIAANFTFEADIVFDSLDGVASLLFRSNDNGWESYMVQIVRHGDNPDTATLRLINANDAALNRLYEQAEVTLQPEEGSNHVKVEADGTKLSVYWNGATTPTLSAVDEAYANGKLGLHIYNASATFQNIFVNEQSHDFSGLKSNLTDWQLREPGTADVDQNGLTLSSENYITALAETISSDILYEADVMIKDEQAAAALLLRADYSGRSGYIVQADHKTQKLRIVSLNGTSGRELLAETAAVIDVNKTYRLRVKAEGSKLLVYWNGKYDPLLQVDSATMYTEGRLGVQSFGGAVQFQNVYVNQLATNVTDWLTLGGAWLPHLKGVQAKSNAAEPEAWSLRIGRALQAGEQDELELERDLVLEGDLIVDADTTDASAALLLRASADGEQAYLVTLSANGNVQLLKKNDDNITVEEAGFHAPLTAGKSHHVEIVVEGAALRVYVDGYSTPVIHSEELDVEFGSTAVGIAVTEGSAYFQNIYATALEDYYAELYRPQYHYSPARGAASDPNGLVYFNGEYHLFHQDGGQWAHAISTDLLHWKRMPIALPWNELGHIWSGSAVADLDNASGLFGDSGGQGLIAYYTSFHPDKPGGNQKIGMAYSKDSGRTWEYYGDEAIVPNPGGAEGGWDFRDPKVVRDEANNRWVMVVSGGDNIHFLTSTNLIDWQRTDQFGFNEISVDGEWQEGVWECPDFFPLTVEGSTTKKWVLMISTGANPKTVGSESRYFIGEFSAEGKFINDNPVRTMLKMEYGKEMYASMSFDNEPDGRRIMMAWMTNWDYPFSFPTSPWKGTLTIPRELYLLETAEGIRLAQRPVSELESLRVTALEWNNETITPEMPQLLSDFKGSAYEIEAELELPTSGAAAQFGFRVREGGEQATLIGYRTTDNKLFVDRSASGRVDFSDKFTKLHEVSVTPTNNRISLRILVDESSVEVFADGGTKAFTELIFPDGARDGLSFYAEGGAVNIVSLKIYPLANVWKSVAVSNEQAREIRLDRPAYELGVGEQKQVYASVMPYTVTNKQLVWESGDSSIVQVAADPSGSALIQAVGFGTTTVTVCTVDGTVSNSFTVTVGSFISNLEGWTSYPNSQWVPTARGIRGFYGSDAAYMSSYQAANFTYEADVTMTERGAGSILFRANADGTAGYYFNIDPNMRALRLFYKAPGKDDVEQRMVLANVPRSININEAYHVKIVAEGMSIKGYLNGEQVIDVQDDTYHQGYFGLNVFDGYVYYQNVIVSDDTAIDSRQYKLLSELNERVMSVDNQENFARLKGSISTGSDHEKWLLVPLEHGDYSIRTALTGKALDWDTGQNRIQLYPYLGYDNQRWQLVEHEDGSYTIVSTRDQDKALQINAAGEITLATRNDEEQGQIWHLQQIVTPTEPDKGEEEDNGGGGGDGNGSGGNGNNNGEGSDTIDVQLLVDGRPADYAVVKQLQERDVTLTEVVLDAVKLGTVIDDRQSVRLDIHVCTGNAVRITGLTQADLQRFAAANVELVIHTPQGIIPFDAAGTNWATAAGNQAAAEPSNPVQLLIAGAELSLVQQAKQQAAAEGYKLLIEPLAITFTGVQSGEEINLGFKRYAYIMLALPQDWDGESLLTVVTVHQDGSVSPLPTKIVEVDGKQYALARERLGLRTYALAERAVSFLDTAEHWASEVARAMGERFIMNRDEQGRFLPDEPMTRSQLAAIIVRGLGVLQPTAADSSTNSFSDLNADSWDAASVVIAKQLGIINGFTDGTFRGSTLLTREQAIVTVYRSMLLIREEKAMPLTAEQQAAALSRFKDAAQLSAWAREAVAYLVHHNIVKGNGQGELNPTGTLTRAEAASMLYHLLLNNDFIE